MTMIQHWEETTRFLTRRCVGCSLRYHLWS